MGDPGFDLDFSLDGKVSLVTGSARGIGKAIALLYAKKKVQILSWSIWMIRSKKSKLK